MTVAKVVELIGSSKKGFEDAINQAVKRTGRTIRGVRGVDVVGQNATVRNGKIIEYRVHLKVSFGVEE